MASRAAKYANGLLQGAIISFALWGLPACDQAQSARPNRSDALATNSSSAKPLQRQSVIVPSAAVAKVFTPDIIGAQLAYLEQQTGPAWRVSGSYREYKLDGCEMAVGENNGDVDWVALNVTPRCTFDLKPWLWNLELPPLEDLTFGAFDKSADAIYEANCLRSCGIAIANSLYLTWFGSRADANIEVVLEAIPDEVTGAAMDAWLEAMSQEKDAYIDNTLFNCDGRYQKFAKANFGVVRVGRITIGRGLSGENDGGCPVPQAATAPVDMYR